MNAQHQLEGDYPDSVDIFEDTVGFTDLALACALSIDDLRELMEYGALQPLASALPEPIFAMTCLTPLQTAGKIRRDYDLDLFVVVIVMDYLQRIELLESQLRTLQAERINYGVVD